MSAEDAAVSADLAAQLQEELMMDRLLERPERKYTDVQELVADFKLEQRRVRAGDSVLQAHQQHRHNDDDDDDDDDGAAAADYAEEAVRSSTVGRVGVRGGEQVVREAVHARSGPKTGPKAVIADQREHVRREHAKWQLQQAEADAAALRNTPTVRTVREDDVHASLAQQLADGVAVEQLADDDAADDAFMRDYRAKRVAELKAAAAAASALSRSPFGALLDLTEDGYAAILDDTRSDVVSVVHIFDEQLVACRRLNAKLRLLAAKHAAVRFGAIELAAIGSEFDRSALPLLVVYQHGQVTETFFNVSRVLGETSFDEHDVERLLGAAGALRLKDIED